MSAHRLTKTDFMAWLHCPRRLWLRAHRPDTRRPLTAAEQMRIDAGISFGRGVTGLFPGGVRIDADRGDPAAALAETARVLAEGTPPALFEPAFLHDDVLVRADVLARRGPGAGAGGWDLIEVKSGTNSSGNASRRRRKLDEHLSDMAIQLRVLEGAGLGIARVRLAWVNADYVRRGALDWRQLVADEDHTDAVRARAEAIQPRIDAAFALLDQPDRPHAEYGSTKCGACEFSEHCWGGEPRDSIIHLPRVSEAQLAQWRARGIERIGEIPSDIDLPRGQAAARDGLGHTGAVVVEASELQRWLDTLAYPLHYLDFETWSACLPPVDGTRPYEQIPFQYSLHVQHEPGAEPVHRELLADAHGDPRPGLIEQLVADIGPHGSIVVHYASFERGCLERLAEMSAGHRPALESMVRRLVDTEVPFRRHWILHPELLGRSSIKVVLPALVPELGYGDLSITDGTTAAARFGELYEGKVTGAEAERVREALRAYCRRDTEAMVEVVGRLRELGDGAG